MKKKIKLKVIQNKNLPMWFGKDSEWHVYKLFLSSLHEMPILFSTLLTKYKSVYGEKTWAVMAAESRNLFWNSALECRQHPFTLKIVNEDGWEKRLNDSWTTSE